jgi:hypothetical protein
MSRSDERRARNLLRAARFPILDQKYNTQWIGVGVLIPIGPSVSRRPFLRLPPDAPASVLRPAPCRLPEGGGILITPVIHPIPDLAGRNIDDQLAELDRVARAFEALLSH